LADAGLFAFIPLIKEGSWPKRAARQPHSYRQVRDYVVGVMHLQALRRKHSGGKFGRGERTEELDRFLALMRREDLKMNGSDFLSARERASLRDDVLAILNKRGGQRQLTAMKAAWRASRE
jgi:hypothetical protein